MGRARTEGTWRALAGAVAIAIATLAFAMVTASAEVAGVPRQPADLGPALSSMSASSPQSASTSTATLNWTNMNEERRVLKKLRKKEGNTPHTSYSAAETARARAAVADSAKPLARNQGSGSDTIASINEVVRHKTNKMGGSGHRRANAGMGKKKKSPMHMLSALPAREAKDLPELRESLVQCTAHGAGGVSAQDIGFTVSERGGGSQRPAAPMLAILILRHQKMAYVVMPKCGSKTMRSYLHKFGVEEKPFTYDVWRFLRQQNYFVFTFVRDPIAHWVSGFKQSFNWAFAPVHYHTYPCTPRGANKQAHRRTLGKPSAGKAAAAKRSGEVVHSMSDSGLRQKAAWFVEHMQWTPDQLQAMLRGNAHFFFNRHIDPMVRRLLLFGLPSPGKQEAQQTIALHFDFIGRLEHLEEDWAELISLVRSRGVSVPATHAQQHSTLAQPDESDSTDGEAEQDEEKEAAAAGAVSFSTNESLAHHHQHKLHIWEYCTEDHHICRALQGLTPVHEKRICEFIQSDLLCLSSYYPVAPMCEPYLKVSSR